MSSETPSTRYKSFGAPVFLRKLPLCDDLAPDQPYLTYAPIGALPLAKVKSRIEVVVHRIKKIVAAASSPRPC
jgi:hypothetical protein